MSAEQHDSHAVLWGLLLMKQAAAEMEARLLDVLNAEGWRKSLAISSGALAGVAGFLSVTRGHAWAANAFGLFQDQAAEHAQQEAAAGPRVLQ